MTSSHPTKENNTTAGVHLLTTSIFTTLLLLLCLQSSAIAKSKTADRNGYLVVTDYIKNDGKTDLADAIQKLIDENPNRTIFFPDGVYLVSHPILTPADPKKSVSLRLANFACIQAMGEWTEKEAVIRLGGKDAFNTIYVPGSNYSLSGGIIDGNNVANGVSIDSGRETRVEGVSIKRTVIGLHVKHGANSGSSDADIVDVNITGNGTEQSIGLLVEGFDNTFTNMRIADVNTGVWLKSAGNSLRNIHPLYIYRNTQKYETSCGFRVDFGSSWFYYCYSDQMATGFHIGKNARVHLTDCYCYWYRGDICPSQTAIECEGPFVGIATGFQADFHKDCKNICLLKGEKGGNGKLLYPIRGKRKLSEYDISQEYIKE